VTAVPDVYPQLEPPSHDVPDIDPRLFYFGRVGAGMLWRLGLLAAAILAAGSGYGPPWYVVAAVIAGGVLLGLWHRGWRVARVWRMLLLAGGVAYLAPLTPVALQAAEAGFGIALVAPWLAARGRR
jgi:hypothetical protein